MASERDAFLAAIRANPDDNTCRLVYSDWLEERGEADYANFIRAQIERDPVSENWFGVDRSRLRDDDLTPGSPSMQLNLPFRHAYQRGFISEIECGLTEYLEYADRLAPYVASMSLNLIRGPGDLPLPEVGSEFRGENIEQAEWLNENFKRLVNCSGLASCHGLNFQKFCMTEIGMMQLARSRYLKNLTWFSAKGNCIGTQCQLVDSANFANLRSLDLSDNFSAESDYPGDDSLAAILYSRHLAKLEELHFTSNEVSSDAFQKRRWFSCAEHLRLLNLSANPIGDAGVRSLASMPFLRLESLSLSACRGVTADSILALTSSNLMGQLTHLDVSHCVIGDVGLRAIATSPRASSLRYLFADKTHAQEKSLRELIRSPHLQGLRGLHVGGVDLDPYTIDLLASQRIMPQLHELSVTIPDTLPNRSELISHLARRFGSNLFVEPGPNRS